MVRRKGSKMVGITYIRKKITHLYKNVNYGKKVDVYFFNDLIEIDNFGNLFINGHVRQGESSGNGYLKNGIMTSLGIRVNFRTHCVVGQVFLNENIETKLIINHKNLNKLDNRVDNLEWITKKENSQHWVNAKYKKDHKNNLTFNFPIIEKLHQVTNEMRL